MIRAARSIGAVRTRRRIGREWLWRLPDALARWRPKRASASRSSGEWRDDDYSVLENGVVVGRIFLVPTKPSGRPWIWASRHDGQIERAAHRYAASREEAMPHSRSRRQEGDVC